MEPATCDEGELLESAIQTSTASFSAFCRPGSQINSRPTEGDREGHRRRETMSLNLAEVGILLITSP